ncbi:MAG: PQQ-dependent sugar dehydrogenase [Pseudomonadota bacterium]
MKHAFLGLFSAILITFSTQTTQADTRQFSSEAHDFRVEVLTNALANPWGMAFLPDGRILITEKNSRLRLFANGQLSDPLSGLPDIAVVGQGGLLDVAVDPDFSDNRMVYLSYSEPGDGGYGTAVLRGRLGERGLSDTEVIFRQNRKTSSGRHFGSRFTFARDKTLFITLGDRADRPSAQDPFDHSGSVLRINRDGSIPSDNPFVDGNDALPEIWSIGHRNVQGADLHPDTGELWTIEHGARGGDEVNLPKAGKNYGWPVISYGRHYSGAKIGVGVAQEGMEQPLHYWDPSIAPAGSSFYDGDLFPEWRGNLFVSALKFQLLSRLELNGEKVVREERLLEGEYGRIRDVETGPDGALYLLTNDGDGLLLRLSPAK